MNSPTSPGRRLRDAWSGPAIAIPGVFNALVAKMAERLAFYLLRARGAGDVATQAGEGRVTLKQRFIDGGYAVADNLGPRKARILLMLALTKTRDVKEIQRMMLTY